MMDRNIDALCQLLREQGLTYKQIGERVGLSTPKAWVACNRERNKQNNRESFQRYKERGCVPLWQGEVDANDNR